MCSKTQFGTGTMRKKSFLKAAGIAALTAVVLIGCGGKNHSTGGGGKNNDTADTTYVITFDPNGGDVSPTSDTTGVDGRLDSLPTPTRNDYAFTGWFTAITSGTEVTDTTVFNNDTTIYAQWTPAVYYTILFNANGGTGTTTGEMTGPDGRLATLPTPTRSGYAFNGWFTAVTGGTAVTTSTVFTANTTIYAKWSIACTITFDANGGTVNPASGVTGANGTLASLPTPTRNDYVFDGWYTTDNGGTMVTENTVFSANATIYARWVFGFVDSRDGKVYSKVVIGTQTWMKENLNYEASGSVCYENSADSCAKYGRLYDWNTAMNGAPSSLVTPSGVQGACPVGWHLPSDAEWTILTSSVGAVPGTKLKSSEGWYSDNWHPYPGTDDYGFSALPGGGYFDDGCDYCGSYFQTASYCGYWWSATDYTPEYNEDYALALYREMEYGSEFVRRGSGKQTFHKLSIRCVQD